MVVAMFFDIRNALRMIARNRLFAAVVISVLGLGIGANTAIFSAVESIMLRPLPFPDSNRLAFVWETSPRSSTRIGPSGPTYLDYKEQSASFDDLALLELGSGTVTGLGEPQQVPALRVTANYLSVLGTRPAQGRDFQPGESWQDRVIIISYGFWERNLGRRADVIGLRLLVDDLPYTIIGVTPKAFWSPVPSELLVPWSAADLRWNPADQRARNRTDHDFGVIGRLKRGVSPERAAIDLSAIERRISQSAPQLKDWGVTVVPLQRLVAENLESSLIVLLTAVGLVLLIACANIANLMIARALARERETAIRAALGANRWRLVRQSLTESAVLAAAAGAAGLLIALWGVDVLDRMLPATLTVTDGGVVTRPPVAFDAMVFGFAILAAAMTAMGFGLAPALAATRLDVNVSLTDGARATAHGQGQVRRLLIITEISLALVLLVSAALTVKSFWRLQHVDPGFTPDHLLALEMELPTDARYRADADQTAFFSRVLEKAAAVPGVQRAAFTTILPLDPTIARGQSFEIVNRPPPARGEQPRSAARRSVSASYFQTMGVPLRRGRTFTDADRDGRPYVAIIDDTFARWYFGSADPLGQRLRIGRTDLEIVGVVGIVKQTGLDKQPAPTLYLSLLQVPESRMSLVVRTAGDPATMVTAVKRAVYAIDPDQPVYRIRTMDQVLSELTAPQRLTLILLTLFACAALCLASIGIYGLVAYTVVQRTREIGIRIALGAQTQRVVRLLVGQGVGAAVVGIAVGLVLSIATTSAMASILYGVNVHDPIVFVATAAVLGIVVTIASYAPARRAVAINPIISLRSE
jgi:putative ABC transport system permease protein